jgi:hypothetical protein
VSRGPALLRSTAAVLVALACATPQPPTDAALPDASTARVEIGLRESGAVFTPWHDGDVIPLVWGPQGGVMITPSVAIDGTLVSDASPALDVALSNLVLPGLTPLDSFPGYGPVHALFARLDARLVNGPIFDQLGWTETPGLQLRLRAHVSGSGIDAVGSVDIVVAPSGTSDGGLDGGAPD